MYKLFGYGSLVSASSASKTLKRDLSQESMQDALLLDHIRSWDFETTVLISPYSDSTKARFLNLRPNAGRTCNGVVFDVSSHELEFLDARELGYSRVLLPAVVEQTIVDVYCYIAKCPVTGEGAVLQGYLDLINEALSRKSEAFREEFWRSTETLPNAVVAGEYKFANSTQNEMTGRR